MLTPRNPTLVVVAERHEAPFPSSHRPAPAAASHVDDAAERVPAEERALRTAHELDLIDLEQIDARRVGIELRHAVEVCGDRRIAGLAPMPRKRAIAQLPGGELGEVHVRCIDAGVADESRCPRPRSSAAGTAVTLTGQCLRVGWFLLRRRRSPVEVGTSMLVDCAPADDGDLAYAAAGTSSIASPQKV